MELSNLMPASTSRLTKGETIWRLTPKSFWRTAGRTYYAICDCQCGTTNIPVRLDGIINGTIKSCGCFTKDRLTTHGVSKHPAYRRWCAMMARCTKEHHSSYGSYGGRGITVCERWKDPAKFIEDMGGKFRKHLELDRIDPNGDYCPENCRWITKKDNLNNKRNTHHVAAFGKVQTLIEWERDTGIPAKLIRKRIFERGWSAERALKKPAN